MSELFDPPATTQQMDDVSEQLNEARMEARLIRGVDLTKPCVPNHGLQRIHPGLCWCLEHKRVLDIGQSICRAIE